jgi:hypothetical protein
LAFEATHVAGVRRARAPDQHRPQQHRCIQRIAVQLADARLAGSPRSMAMRCARTHTDARLRT